MNRIFKHIPAAVAAIFLWSCSPTASETENINTAREYIDAAEYESAQSICDRMRENIYAEATPTDAPILAELSLLYMRLADADDRQDNVGFAYWCYQEAFRQDSTAATQFYSNAGVDDMPLISILNSIAAIASRRNDQTDFADETDSISATTLADEAPATENM